MVFVMDEFELYKHLKIGSVRRIVQGSLMKEGCTRVKGEVVADNLIEADLRGIPSHGVARLQRYLEHIRQGVIDPKSKPRVVYQTALSAVVDGMNGIGQYTAKVATDLTIKMAKKTGAGIVVVRNSNHYGIAGYYAERIAKSGMIGFSATNTAPMVVPTFSRETILGTNPIAVAFPADLGYPYMVDMATSVIPRGKLEVHARNKKAIPAGWCVDAQGHTTTDPGEVLENLKGKKGGGILPLGGEGEEFGGHKGYGLAMIVELLTAGLSLGEPSWETYRGGHGGICHLFAGIRVDLFGDPERITERFTSLLMKVKTGNKACGAKEIYLHNEKEYRARAVNIKMGVPVDRATYNMLVDISRRYGLGVRL